MSRLSSALLTTSSLILLLAWPGWTGEIVRHSGTIVEIDDKTESIVIEEIGPWHVTGGNTHVAALRIVIAPDAPIVVSRRSAQAPSGFVGDFVEESLAPWGLAPGDFVTVECWHEGKRLVARKVTVAGTVSRAYGGDPIPLLAGNRGAHAQALARLPRVGPSGERGLVSARSSLVEGDSDRPAPHEAVR